MKLLSKHVIGIPINSAAYPFSRSTNGFLVEHATQYHIASPANGSTSFKQNKEDSVINIGNKIRKIAGNYLHRVREHVRLGPKISETLKGKISLGARIIQLGGMENVYKQLFRCEEGEKLLNASQCYLSTTTGPIAGLLFISTDKISFCSERSLKISSPKGDLIRVHYKVMIPLRKIKRVDQTENVSKPSQKYIYIEIVTMDNFDFWFMGFFNHQKPFRILQQAISPA